MSNKPDKSRTFPQRDGPALAIDDANQENEQISPEDDPSSPMSLLNTSSESASVSANITEDLRTEPDGKDSESPTYQVKDKFFFREESEQNSTEIQKSKNGSSSKGSTTRLCPLPNPLVDERLPSDKIVVPPKDLNVPTISVKESLEESSTKTKSKGTLGDAFNKLVVRLSPRKEKLSPSGASASADDSVSPDASPSPSGGTKKKKSKASPLRFLLGKDKSPKNSPDKKKSPLKSLVQNALHPKKKLFPKSCSSETTDHLCDLEDPPKTTSEKPKRSKSYWENVRIPKDFKKVETTDFSDTTIDSLSTQCSSTTDSPMSDVLNPNQEDVTDQEPRIPQIPESSKPETDKEDSAEE